MAVKSKKDRIGKMIDALKKAAEGDYSIKLDISSKNDEIDSLADAINKTMEKRGKLTTAEGQDDVYRKDSEERYRNILDNIEESYFEVDLKGNLQFFNDSVIRHMGYTADDLAGMNFLELVDKENGNKVYKAFHKVFQTGDPVDGFDWEILRKNGTKLDIESSVVLRRDDRGKPIGFRGVVRDVTRRKQAEAELRQSEERYRMIAENMSDIVWTLDFNLQFIYVSPSNGRITGYTSEEVRNIPLNKILTSESFTLAAETLSRELAAEAGSEPTDPNRSRTMELEVYHKNGGTVWLEVTATFNRDDNSKAVEILAVGRNITQRRRIEKALEESEKRYRMIVENMHDVIWTMNFDFQHTYRSPSNIKISGYTPEEIMSIPAREQVTPESYALAEKILAEELELEFSGKPIDLHRSRTMEVEAYHKNGGTVWLEVTATFSRDENGKPLEILMTARDITEHRRIEKALEESEKRFRMIVENMHDLVWTMDFDMNYQYVSPSETRVTGYTPQEVMSSPLEQQITPESYARALAILAEELEREQSGEPADPHRNRIFDVEMNCKDRSTAWAEITATFDRDEKGKAVGIMMIGKDISERKKAQQEKDKLEQQLIQAQKMETVGRLAGGVAHDFNNMLNVILGYAELTKLRLPVDSEIMQNILEIEKAACRSRDITSQLLAFSRKQIIAPQMINLNKLIAQSQKSIARLIGEDIDLNFFPENDLSMVRFDPSQFEQILMNLAVNARDAMPNGGKLTIETSSIHLDATYCQDHLEFIPGHYVLLAVSDNGMGMDKDTLQYIFEPFFTTKEIGKGTGLGLATVFGIVKQHDGFINVYSEPGQGSTFKIYLPASAANEETVEEIPSEELTVGTGTILLVEDDDMLRSMITEMLETAGYSVITTANPRDALPLCENNDTQIDLLITDVVMPGMNGRELRDKIKVIRPDIKILFMSGYTSNVIVHHGVLEQGVNFLQKPFSMNVLARKVGEMIDGR